MAVNKGRCHNVAMLRITQKIAALALAGGFTVRLRWIPSELNVADGPSRGHLLPGPYQKTNAGPQSNSLNSCPIQEETSSSSRRWSDSGFEQQVVESGQAGEDSSETSRGSVGAKGQGGDSQEEALYPAIAVEGGGQ